MTPGGNRPVSTAWPNELTRTLASVKSASRVWVAFSGGLDSALLLHLARDVLRGWGRPTLQAIHINHQLQLNAEDTEAFCRQTCDALDVPLTVARVDVPVRHHGNTRTGGLEQAARRERYRAFEQVLQAGDVLLMAHHADDQAETLLFRMIRGSGLAGLAGMPRRRRLGDGELVRPLLAFSRAHLLAWASDAGLNWVEDPSNQDERFDRNFLRHRIMPALSERWPHLLEQMIQTSVQCREGEQLTQRLAELQYPTCATPDHKLRVEALLNLSLAEQKNLIAWWLQEAGLTVPSMRHWDTALPELLAADDDRAPEIRGRGFVVRRYHGCLYRVSEGAAVPETECSLVPEQSVSWGCFMVSLTQLDLAAETRFRITPRRGGERIRERPDGPSRPLKKWLQDKRVPPWERDRLPLVWHGNQLIAVGDLWLAAGYTGATPTSGWRVVCERDFN